MVTVMILETGKRALVQPLTYRKRGLLAHFGAHPTTMNLSHAQPKIRKLEGKLMIYGSRRENLQMITW